MLLSQPRVSNCKAFSSFSSLSISFFLLSLLASTKAAAARSYVTNPRESQRRLLLAGFESYRLRGGGGGGRGGQAHAGHASDSLFLSPFAPISLSIGKRSKKIRVIKRAGTTPWKAARSLRSAINLCNMRNMRLCQV
jgi:hypothetical protein